MPLGAFVRRRGFQRHRRIDGRAGRPAGQDLLDRFRRPEFDETAYALKVAERYHTDHRTDTVKADDFALVDRLDGCSTNPSPTVRRCRPTASARRHASASPWRCRAMVAAMRTWPVIGATACTWRRATAQPPSAGPAQGDLRTAGRAIPQGGLGTSCAARQDHFPGPGQGQRVGAWFHSVSRMTDEQRRIVQPGAA